MDVFVNLTFIAQHYSLLCVLLLLSYIAGSVIIKSYAVPEDSGRVFLYTSSGIGVIIVALFYVSLFGLFNRSTILSGMLLFLGYYCVRGDFSIFLPRKLKVQDKESFSSQKKLLWTAAVFMLFSPFLFLPLYPPTAWDEISYHLPYARYYVENMGLSVNAFLRYPLYAHNINLLFALSLLFSDDISAHLIHASTAVLCAVGIYSLGSLTSDKRVGAIAACIFLSSPVVTHLMRTAYIDLGLTLFVFLSFYCISVWSIKKQEHWLYFAGAAAGVAAGSKYSGLFYIPMFLVWIGYESRKLSSVMKFVLPAFLFGAPWYVRNVIISGDPVSPFGGDVFGYWLWNKEDLVAQSQDLLTSRGTRRNLISFLKLPWHLFRHYDKFGEGSLSPGVFAVFPAVLLFKKLDSFNKKLCVFVFVNIIIWFFTSQILRYLLPVLPMIALLSARVLIYLYRNFIKKPLGLLFSNNLILKHASQTVISAIAVSLIILPVLRLDADILKGVSRDPFPVTQKMRNEYLCRKIESFNLLQIANENPSFNIYQLGFEDSFYFSQGKMMGDWYGPARYSIILDVIGDSKRLYDKLNSMNIQLFLVSTGRSLKFEFDRSFSDYFEMIEEDEHGQLYVLRGVNETAAEESKIRAAFVGCATQQKSRPLVLKKFGPEHIRAGQVFNKQPNGESALWAETENATPTTVFVLNGVPLESAPQSEGRAVSAIVPKRLYEKPGEYPLYLLDKKTNRKSNELKFIVKALTN